MKSLIQELEQGVLFFEKVSGKKLNYKIVPRRVGDITEAYANTEKANNELGWKAESTLDEAMKSAWDWEQKVRAQADNKL